MSALTIKYKKHLLHNHEEKQSAQTKSIFLKMRPRLELFADAVNSIYVNTKGYYNGYLHYLTKEKKRKKDRKSLQLSFVINSGQISKLES